MGKGPLAQYLGYLIAVVEAEPDITMPELAARLQAERGVTAAWASLSVVVARKSIKHIVRNLWPAMVARAASPRLPKIK